MITLILMFGSSISKDDLESAVLHFTLTHSKKASQISKKKAHKVFFQGQELSSLKFGLAIDETSETVIIEAESGVESLSLSFQWYFSGKELINDLIHLEDRQLDILESLLKLANKTDILISYITHRPTLEHIIELTHKSIIKPRRHRLLRKKLQALWLILSEIRFVARLFECQPDLSLHLLSILLDDNLKHLHLYSSLFPMIRQGINLPVGRKMLPIFIPLLEDCIKLTLDPQPTSSVDAQSSNISTPSKSQKSSKKPNNMENIVSTCSSLFGLLVFYDPKYASYVANKTNVIPLVASILENDRFTLHNSAFSALNWFGKEFISILDTHRIFEILSSRMSSPSYTPRLMETLTLLKQFGKGEADISIPSITHALESDLLPPLRIQQYVQILQTMVNKSPQFIEEELINIVNACLLLLTKSTAREPIYIVEHLRLSKKLNTDTFFKTRFMELFGKSLVDHKNNILSLTTLFVEYVAEPVQQHAQLAKRDAYIVKLLPILRQNQFWKCCTDCFEDLASNTSTSTAWTTTNLVMCHILMSVLSILSFGPKDVVEEAYNEGFFASIQKLLHTFSLVNVTVQYDCEIYFYYMFMMDRMFTLLLEEEKYRDGVEKLRLTFIEDLKKHSFPSLRIPALQNLHIYPSIKQWLLFANRYCDLDKTLEKVFLHLSTFRTTVLASDPIDVALSFIGRVNYHEPKLVNLNQLADIAKQVYPDEKRSQISEIVVKITSNVASVANDTVDNIKNSIRKSWKGLKSLASAMVDPESPAEPSLPNQSSSTTPSPSSSLNIGDFAVKFGLPTMLEFFELCVPGGSLAGYYGPYLDLFDGICKLISIGIRTGAMVDRTPSLFALVVWHIEMSFTVIDSLPLLKSHYGNDVQVRYDAFYRSFKEILKHWMIVSPNLHQKQTLLFHVSNWIFWPNIIKFLFHKSSIPLLMASSVLMNIVAMQEVFLNSFFSSRPIVPLFDLLDEHMALSFLTKSWSLVGTGTIGNFERVIQALAMTLNETLEDFDPRFISAINSNWQANKTALTPMISTRTQDANLQPLSMLAALGNCAIRYQLENNSTPHNSEHLNISLDAFFIDSELRHFISWHVLRLFKILDPAILLSTLFNAQHVLPLVYTFIMEPNFEYAEMALDLYEKLAKHDSVHFNRANQWNFRRPWKDGYAWSIFAKNPNKLLRWIKLRMEVATKNVLLQLDIADAQHMMMYFALEYTQQIMICLKGESKWAKDQQFATKEAIKLSEGRATISLPSTLNDFASWFQRRKGSPSYTLRSLPKLQSGIERNGCFFAPFDTQLIFVPEDPVKTVKLLFKVILECWRHQPDRKDHYHTFGNYPRRGFIFPYQKPAGFAQTSIKIPEVYSYRNNSLLSDWTLSLQDHDGRGYEFFTETLPQLPDQFFPDPEKYLNGEHKSDEEAQNALEMDEIVIELICRFLSRGHSLSLTSSSGVIGPLKRFVTKMMETPNGSPFASNDFITRWSTYLYGMSKATLSCFLPKPLGGFDYDREFVFSLMLRAEHQFNLFTANSENEGCTFLELVFSLVKFDWPLYESTVMPKLLDILERHFSDLKRTQTAGAIQSSVWPLMKGRLIAFLGLYEPGEPIDEDLASSSTTTNIKNPAPISAATSSSSSSSSSAGGTNNIPQIQVHSTSDEVWRQRFKPRFIPHSNDPIYHHPASHNCVPKDPVSPLEVVDGLLEAEESSKPTLDLSDERWDVLLAHYRIKSNGRNDFIYSGTSLGAFPVFMTWTMLGNLRKMFVHQNVIDAKP
jgi:hypothetical protein